MSAKVQYKFLGKSGLKVSNICLGTMTFGDGKDGLLQCSEKDAHALMDRFVGYGGNFIDTADMYSGGLAEKYVGSWLKNKDRKRYVIATKLFVPLDPTDPNAEGLSRKKILSALDESLERLQTDYIDIYQIHRFDEGTPIEETFSTLNDLVRCGKIRYIGVSNATGWQLQKIVDVCKSRGWEDIICMQQHYSLLGRFSEQSEFRVCKNEGIGVLPWSPLKGGALSGKYKRNQRDLPPGRISWAHSKGIKGAEDAPEVERFDNEPVWKLLELMEEIAKSHGKSVAQVGLRWLLQKDVVSAVVIGARTMEQLDDNMGAGTGWELTQEQMCSLDAASAYDIPYPYNMHARENANRWH